VPITLNCTVCVYSAEGASVPRFQLRHESPESGPAGQGVREVVAGVTVPSEPSLGS
jgi:hypothetical protein